jgi:hypothetical protein
LAAIPLIAAIAIIAIVVMLFRSTAAGISRLVGARRMLRATTVAVVTTSATVTAGRPRAAWCRGEESGGGVGSWLAHDEFLEEELSAGLEECNVGNSLARRRWIPMGANFLLRPPMIEDERTVRDVLTETAQGISHGLEASIVVSDGEVTLDEGAELSVEENGTLLP